MNGAVRERSRPRTGDPALAGLGVLAALVALGYGADLAGPRAQLTACWLILVALQGADVRLSVSLRTIEGISPATRRFWLLAAAGFALFWAGTIVELGRTLILPRAAVTGSSTFQLLTLAGGGLVLVLGMLGHPLALEGRRERRRFWLDAATVMVAGVAFAWYLTAPDAGPTADGAALVRSLAGPGIFVVIGFGLIKLALTRNPPFTPVGAAFGGLAAVLEVLSTGLDHLLVASGHTSWSTALALLANVSLTAGLRIQQVQVRRNPELLRSRPSRPYSKLPYTALAATFGLLVRETAAMDPTGRTWCVVAAAVISTGLVVLRQLAAFADNIELVGRLDAKVRELAVAQAAMQHALDERDTLADKLRHQAHHDDLTGLANRALFLAALDAAITRMRVAGPPFGVLMIDLNDFKPVNDRHGHRAGDQVLHAVAQRLLATVRDDDTVARLGGDEFAVLVQPATDLEALAARVTAAVREPVSIEAGEVVVGASVGVVRSDEPGLPALLGTTSGGEDFLQEADHRMYRAKQEGKDRSRNAV